MARKFRWKDQFVRENLSEDQDPYVGDCSAVSHSPADASVICSVVDFVLDTGSLAQVKAGSLKALAVASEKRLPALPDVPTFAELGYKGMLASAWYGILAPANLLKPVQELLNREVNAVLEDPEVRQLMEQNLGAIVSPGHTPAWFANFMKSELAKYAEIVRISGAKME